MWRHRASVFGKVPFFAYFGIFSNFATINNLFTGKQKSMMLMG